MIVPCIPPSRWWRRGRTISVTVWPDWLAKFLCPHKVTHRVAWDDNEEYRACQDCNKWLGPFPMPPCWSCNSRQNISHSGQCYDCIEREQRVRESGSTEKENR